MHLRSLSVLVILLICNGCLKERRRLQLPVVVECEAGWSDVIVAVDAQPIKSESTYQTYVYTTFFSLDELEKLYRRQMERLGWDLVAEHGGKQLVMLFRKPAIFCVVITEKTRKRCKVRVDRMVSSAVL